MVEIFSERDTIIEDVINRILNCMGLNQIYIYDQTGSSLVGLYKSIKRIYLSEFDFPISEGFAYIKCTDRISIEKALSWIKGNKERVNVFLHIASDDEINDELMKSTYGLEQVSSLHGKAYFFGKIFECPDDLQIPAEFKVLAIIHTYNESDIIGRTIAYLLEQGLDIYLIDNWSDDETFEIALEYQKRYPDRIFLEKFPYDGKTEYYEWYQQLERTEEISKTLSYDWFTHYDADEMRISPWKQVTLRQFIFWSDQLGYNLIDSTVINFKLTEGNDENIFMKDTYFDFGHQPTHFMQIKTWKKTESINLKRTGGHLAEVYSPRIYPLKLLNRHYPFRNIEQAWKKVMIDRKPRFSKERKERGWHGQYDLIQNRRDLLGDRALLLHWDKTTFYDYYIPLFLGCGIKLIEKDSALSINMPIIADKKVVLYGAGFYGKQFCKSYAVYCNIVGWVDQKYKYMPNCCCLPIAAPDKIKDMDFDYIVVTVMDRHMQNDITEYLDGLEIPEDKILFLNKECR